MMKLAGLTDICWLNPTVHPRPREGNDLMSVAQQGSDCLEVRPQASSGPWVRVLSGHWGSHSPGVTQQNTLAGRDTMVDDGPGILAEPQLCPQSLK